MPIPILLSRDNLLTGSNATPLENKLCYRYRAIEWVDAANRVYAAIS